MNILITYTTYSIHKRCDIWQAQSVAKDNVQNWINKLCSKDKSAKICYVNGFMYKG